MMSVTRRIDAMISRIVVPASPTSLAPESTTSPDVPISGRTT
jgi:hypothetical protein